MAARRQARLQLTGNRRAVAVDDPRLQDRVADNASETDRTESESLLFGTGFGTVSDVQTGPDGAVHVVDHSREVVWRIGRR